ncbi:MAG: tRNA (adenosine(37)-N6)-threonylcarbamoyltransferase complex dimerization subunit type 1 TsaB [Gammaproteobacteria bacterium]|jgi:tRNA threonylcarbamoyladenosine biosynthesis protein TsaB
MRILCIETSVATGGVALQDGERLFEYAIATPRAHAEELIPRIDAILTDAGIGLEQLDAIAFGRGPGSFIGVRLATAVAQGLATGARVGLAPIPSMAALAWRAGSALPAHAAEALRVVVCLDARMQEVYLAEYTWRKSGLETTASERLLRPGAVRFPSDGRWLAVGGGFTAYPDLRERALGHGGEVSADLDPRARDLLPFAQTAVSRGELIAPEAWRGVYLRDESAWQRPD